MECREARCDARAAPGGGRWPPLRMAACGRRRRKVQGARCGGALGFASGGSVATFLPELCDEKLSRIRLRAHTDEHARGHRVHALTQPFNTQPGVQLRRGSEISSSFLN